MASSPGDAMAALQRYGRQLLVDGVSLPAQQALRAWCLVLDGDGSDVVRLAAEVALRYGVGAGLGRCASADAAVPTPADLDPGVEVLAPGRSALQAATPPVAHVYLALRPYGASIDLLLVEAGAVDATVATAIVRGGAEAPLGAGDATALGTLAARLVVDHLLALAKLPSVLHIDWGDGDRAPSVRSVDAGATQAKAERWIDGDDRGLWRALRGDDAAMAVIRAHAEACYPNEACGFVVRRPDGALEAVPSRNLQDRYHGVDPEAYPRTSRTAFLLDQRLIARREEQGDALVVIFHTHCEAGAYFSREDARAAAPEGEPTYPEVGHLVISVRGGVAVAAAMFHFDAHRRAFVAEAPGVVALGPDLGAR